MQPTPLRCWLLGLPVDALTLDETLAWVRARIVARRGTPDRVGTLHEWKSSPPGAAQVVTLNPEIVMRARSDPELCAIVRQAALVVPDGIGLIWAGRLHGEPLPQRVTGVDLMVALAAEAATQGYRIVLVGAGEGVAAAAARALERRFPPLRIAATFAGSPLAADDAEAVQRIAAARADLVFVAYGAPQQERWIARLCPALGAAVAVGVGGAFDMLAGRVPRAPRWMRQAGLEWLYRLLRQPWRWRRMLALPRFAGVAVWAAWRHRSARFTQFKATQRRVNHQGRGESDQ